MTAQSISEKRCSHCKRVKPLEQFYNARANRVHGKQARCKACCGNQRRIPKIPMDIESRFWRKVHKADGCWEWTGARHPHGYGHIGFEGRVVPATRVSYILHFGRYPEHLQVCHKCDNPPCVRPDHLFLGTRSDNMQDMVQKGRINPDFTARTGNAKLTPELVRRIRARRASERLTYRELASEFSVCARTIIRVLKGASWQYVE